MMFITLLTCLFYQCGLTKEAPPVTQFKNWGLSRVQIEQTWQYEKGSENVIVAVIDTGIDSEHEAFAGNGFVEGWDYVTKKPARNDSHGHGTHVAGIVASMAKNVRFMPVVYYSDTNPGHVNMSNTVQAINYAVTHG